MTHDLAFERLPDLLFDRDDPDLLAHVGSCHRCQRQLFLLSRVDRLLRQRRPRERRLGRVVAALAVVGAIAAAAVVAVILPQRHTPATAQFALKTKAGAIVARAQIEHGDTKNESIAFVAKGLPSRPTDTYLLWTQGNNDAEPVIGARDVREVLEL